METQEAKKKNQETLKLLRKEEKKLKLIKKSVNKFRDSLYEESCRLVKQIERLSHKHDYFNIVRIGDTAYNFNGTVETFQHGLRQNEYKVLDLYDSVDQIIPPSKKESHLGFNIEQQIRIKQEGPVPFRYLRSSFYFPSGVDIVQPGGNHYVLGESLPEEVKNPIVRTTIKCFYGDGKALVEYRTTRNYFSYFEVVDLSNYEICSHLEWDNKKGRGKSFAEYLEANGLTEKIEFKDNFGFRVGEPIYIKSHEIILDNPRIKNEEFEHALGKDLHYLQSFIVKITGIKSSGTCEWSVFGFVGDKVLVECNRYGDYRHFELFSPEEIGLIIDLDYRLKKENYFDRITVDGHGNISKIK